MKVVDFQFQLKKFEQDIIDYIHAVDPKAPRPEALEGGNGKGPLYQCILTFEKYIELVQYCDATGIGKIYTYPKEFELAEDLYRPDYYVHWCLGGLATVTSEQY